MPHVGGAEIAIKEITDRISDIEWHLITLRFNTEPVEEKIGNVIVHRVGHGTSAFAKAMFVRQAAREARRLHARHHFDAAWVMMSYMLMPLTLARLGIPYALTLQEGDTEYHMFGRLRILPFLPLINKGFRNARVVQAISTYLGDWPRKHGFTGSLEIIPNGYIDPSGHTDLHWFETNSHGQNRKIFWKNQHNIEINPETVVLITTSRLVHKNAIDIIIRAMPLLPNEVIFNILGTGKELKALENLAATLKVRDRVHFLGEVKNTAVLYRLHASDIFVRPSRSEGMGNSFIEAMAAGLPVIATQEGGLKDFITSEVAWPVPKDSPQAVADAVQNILSNPIHTKTVVEKARTLAVEKYDWTLIARTMHERVFSRVLG